MQMRMRQKADYFRTLHQGLDRVFILHPSNDGE